MRRVMARRPRFVTRVFTPEELSFGGASKGAARYLAEFMAARGAVLRCLGSTPADEVCILDVSVQRKVGERPQVVLSQRAQELARRRGVSEIALSLSCTGDVAVANAVALNDETRPRPPERPDPKAELRASFREARSVLDELERREGTGAQ